MTQTTGNQGNEADETLTIKIGGDGFSTKKKHRKPTNEIRSSKYTFLSFLPLNLLEQFRRIANFYFLVISIIILLIDSPVSPVTSLMPLAFVISVTAAKQGYEDYLRHKTDNIVNRSPVTVIRDGKEVNIRSQDIVQGDLVHVSKDCDIPCDLVILKSSDPSGKCFVTTANLDGETNLKTLHVPKYLPQLPVDKLHTIGTIECEKPRPDLYLFNGKIMLSPNQQRFVALTDLSSTEFYILPLASDNLLLRGSRLKNTEWVVGCAVYIGQNTKLTLNSKLTRNKMASSEAYINRFLIFVLVVLIFLVTFSYLFKRYYEINVISQHEYVGPAKPGVNVQQFFQDYLSFFILYNYLIPISLYVTIEIHKFLGAFFLEWDHNLYDEMTDQPCIANTSDLNEELGQVNILFSDKTGTLTKNEMFLQKVSINGQKYVFRGTRIEDETTQLQLDVNKFKEDQMLFFQALALCHTVQVAKTAEEDEEVEQVQNIYAFDDIKEEGRNHVETENDEIDYIQVPKANISSDFNPLLKKTESSIASEDGNLKPELKVVRRSPRGNRSTGKIISREVSNNKIHPSSDISLDDGERPVTYPSVSQRGPASDSSRAFYRSTSHVDLQNSNSSRTHRRTQSYGAPGTIQRRLGSTTSSNIQQIASSLSSKQGYAMPTYTRESFVTRAESLRRKETIKNYVEKLDYQASSPDEKALVEACANLGIIYMGDDDETLRLHILSPHLGSFRCSSNSQCKKKYFKRLEVLEFSSDRKRMSVIVKDNDSNIWMYTKGAESFVFPLCGRKSSELIRQTNGHINEFSKEGLRTLAVAMRKLTDNEYKEFRQELLTANSALHNRNEAVSTCYSKVEQNLELLGATAVEDALQDHVRDTLEALQLAGIKIWVLTGDKVETAFNIALSCGHIPENCGKYFITECNSPEEVTQHLNALKTEMSSLPNTPFALLIDGRSLKLALAACPTEFRDISTQCKAVLCCRLSPLQKCEVVHLIKTDKRKYITAAIGDGANDVSMIQEAHIGLGIVGKEGRQAARCADYAFSNFCMLKTLFFIHGHYFTKRLSLLVLYFFYKNIAFLGIQFLFQMDTMFSASSIYDALFLTLYNVLYTALPITVLSLTEKPYKEEVLIKNPQLYLVNTKFSPLQWKCFLGWVFVGVFHCLIIYYFTRTIWTMNDAVFSTPHSADRFCFGTFLIQSVVIVVNLKIWLEAVHQTYIFIASVIISILAFIVSTLVYNVLTFLYDFKMYWIYMNLLASVTCWLMTILTVITCLVPDYTLNAVKRALNMPKLNVFPGDRTKRLLKHRIYPQNYFTSDPVESTNL